MLENPTEAVSELSYFDCIDSVMENSKVQILISLLATLCCFPTSVQKKSYHPLIFRVFESLAFSDRSSASLWLAFLTMPRIPICQSLVIQ